MTTAAKHPKSFKVRKPCERCPFRSDLEPFLTVARAHEIQTSIYQGGPFYCHETIGFDSEEGGGGWDEDSTHYTRTGSESVCAGSIMIGFLEENPDQLTRIAEGLNQDSFADIRNCGVAVYPSFSEWAKAQDRRGSVDPDAAEAEDLDFCSVADMNCEAPAGFAIGGGVVDGDEMTSSKCPDCSETVCPSCLVEDEVEGDSICPYCLETREAERAE